MLTYLTALALQPAAIDLPSIEKTLAAELEETKTPGAALLSVTRLGPDLFSARGPGDRPPIPFRIISGSDGRGELLQMFLWVFKKEKTAP